MSKPSINLRDLVILVADGSSYFSMLVHGMLDMAHGSLAQYVVARPEQLAPVPGALERIAAAAVPLAALTAWQGLFEHGGLRAGQRVLIHGGAGGVGHFAVQLAKARGAHVIASVSTDDLDFTRSLGADELVDHLRQRVDDAVRDVDLVLDLVGGETQERSWTVLRRGGVLVSTVGQPPQDRADAAGVRAVGYMATANGAQLREIDALIQSGAVRPHVYQAYAYGGTKEGLRVLEEGHVTGKIVVDMANLIPNFPDPLQ